jgi:prevent-host-death family protein
LTPAVRDHIVVTMTDRTRQMAAGEFKAKCLAVLDEVAASKRPLVITKRGRPVAKVVPLAESEPAPRKGLIVRQGDLVSPVGEIWDAER